MPRSITPTIYCPLRSDDRFGSLSARFEAGGFRVEWIDMAELALGQRTLGPIAVDERAVTEIPSRHIRNPSLGPWLVLLSGVHHRGRGYTARSSSEFPPDWMVVSPGVDPVPWATWAWVTSAERRFRDAVVAAVGYPPALRRALRIVVQQRPNGVRSVDGVRPAVALRSDESLLHFLARSVDVSPGHLSRAATAGGVALRTVDDAWRCVLALAFRSETSNWEQVAFGLGYSGLTGLSALIHRGLGTGLRVLLGMPAWGIGEAERRLSVALQVRPRASLVKSLPRQ